LFAAGVGIGLGQCTTAVQTVVQDDMVAIASSLVGFSRLFAGTVGSIIGQSVYQASLKGTSDNISRPAGIKHSSASPDLIRSIRDQYGADSVIYRQTLELINHALTRTFMAALIVSSLMLPCALLVEWKSVKKEKREDEDIKEGMNLQSNEGAHASQVSRPGSIFDAFPRLEFRPSVFAGDLGWSPAEYLDRRNRWSGQSSNSDERPFFRASN